MITIAVVNSKGGVGKTTLAAALAVRASQDSPRVAMVDLDPQKSLVDWWQTRGSQENPAIFEGETDTSDAIEKLGLAGYDWVFLDSPPAFLETVAECIACADFVLIPLRPAMLDLIASQDAYVMARDAGATMLLVLNDCHTNERLAKNTRAMLVGDGIPLAKSQIQHRVAHTNAMAVGKSAAEINNGKETKAAAEIDALWKEVKAAATKAAKARAAEMVGTDG